MQPQTCEGWRRLTPEVHTSKPALSSDNLNRFKRPAIFARGPLDDHKPCLPVCVVDIGIADLAEHTQGVPLMLAVPISTTVDLLTVEMA